MKRNVLTFVGEAGSGKEEATRLLRAGGIEVFSLSDSLRNIATRRGLPHDRMTLIELGNMLRERLGSEILARNAELWIEGTGVSDIIIESVRNPAEVEYLRHNLDAYIVGVTMSAEKRFGLMQGRNRPGDPQTWEEFLQLLAIEKGEGEKSTGQQIARCLDLADVIIPNEGSLEELQQKVHELAASRGFLREGRSASKER